MNRRMGTDSSKSPDRGGRVSMKTAAEYRVLAEECFKSAGKTNTDEVREVYLQLARFWLDVASKPDGPPGRKQKRGFRLLLARARLQT
jgi:uncharacterized protein YjhX (UPF0386 family)